MQPHRHVEEHSPYKKREASREDLAARRLYWPDLTPAEYLHLDEEAHEEGFQYGACAPFEKEYISQRWNSGQRSSGGRNVPVSLARHHTGPHGR